MLKYGAPFASGKTAGLAASLVFGQALDFTSTNACSVFREPPDVNVCSPSGVAVDSNGNLFVADTANNRNARVQAPSGSAADTDVVYGQERQLPARAE